MVVNFLGDPCVVAVKPVFCALCVVFKLAFKVIFLITFFLFWLALFKFHYHINWDRATKLCVDDLHALADLRALFKVANEAVFNLYLTDAINAKADD